MTRLVLALALPVLAWSAPAGATSPIPASSSVDEFDHEGVLEVGPAGATITFRRELHNPGGFPAKVDLPLELPCEASLDAVELELPTDTGEPLRVPARIVDAAEGDALWSNFYTTTEARGAELEAALLDPDTALLMTRDDYSCQANLRLFPLPSFSSRAVHYRVFVPAHYVDGEYRVELPTFADYGLPAQIRYASHDRAYNLDIDALAAIADQTLDGASSHELVLRAQDPGLARTASAAFDLEAMFAATPAAQRYLEPSQDQDRDQDPDTGLDRDRHHLVRATFEAPTELARLPHARRVVIVLDRSRSLDSRQRQSLTTAAQHYLEQLGARAEAEPGQAKPKVEILTYAREVEPVYHDLVPLRWASEDLERLALDDANGSNLDAALDHARKLLARPSAEPGADWIVVFSDLRMREAYDYAAEQGDAEANPNLHVHVVGLDPATNGYEPAKPADTWTAIAMASGGMAWKIGSDDWTLDGLGAELVEPQTIWNFGLKLGLDGQAEPELALAAERLERGQVRTYEDYLASSLGRATFHGEVWGRPRAWSTQPSDAEAQRVAAGLATHGGDHEDAVRAVLAHYAQVLSPYTSAWASVERQGSAPRPSPPMGFGGSFGGSYGCSTGCGGGLGRRAILPTTVSLQDLAQAVLDQCPTERQGEFELETTDNEIVTVVAASTCVLEQSWALDITAADLRGHSRYTLHYAAGQITRVDQRAS